MLCTKAENSFVDNLGLYHILLSTLIQNDNMCALFLFALKMAFEKLWGVSTNNPNQKFIVASTFVKN